MWEGHGRRVGVGRVNARGLGAAQGQPVIAPMTCWLQGKPLEAANPFFNITNMKVFVPVSGSQRSDCSCCCTAKRRTTHGLGPALWEKIQELHKWRLSHPQQQGLPSHVWVFKVYIMFLATTEPQLRGIWIESRTPQKRNFWTMQITQSCK